MSDGYRFGIEEEYFLIDSNAKTVAAGRTQAFIAAAKEILGQQVKGELLQSQIEVSTKPHLDIGAARAELRGLRQSIAAIAAEHGLSILAAGTHPTAMWVDQVQTPAERYDAVMRDLQMLGLRNLLCGMHVHVELPDTNERVDVMYRMLPYLPLFVALSTSSPFWQSRATGLKGYRLAAYDELPRTGVPELFRSREEFDSYVEALVGAGVIQDSSYVWWAIRPSLKHPTLELRAPDSCTLVEDSIAIAALYRSLVRRVSRNPWLNWDITPVTRALVVENKWRAQRYGVHGTFVSEVGPVTVGELLEQVLDEVSADAEALGCTAEIYRCRAIVGSGTSADAQLSVFEAYGKNNESQESALNAVTDWIASATLQ